MIKKYLGNVLAIGAHMDDVEVACGGTIPILKKLYGCEVYELIVTDGSEAGKTEVRTKECRASAKILGIKKVFFGNLKDTELPYQINEVIKLIENYLDEVKPWMVLTASEYDRHQDHRACAEATISATRIHRMPWIHTVLMYEIPRTVRTFNPHYYCDISDTIKLKMKSLRKHRSQIERGSMNPEDTIIKAKERGREIGVPYAEAFELNHLLINPKPYANLR